MIATFHFLYYVSVLAMLLSFVLKIRAASYIYKYRSIAAGKYSFWVHVTHGVFWLATALMFIAFPPTSIHISTNTIMTINVNTIALLALFVTFIVDRIPAAREALYMSGDTKEQA